jgi:cyclohexyl-isocyanide hydratase
MSVPLFLSERSKPKITTQPLSVGCLIFERMDQIDFTGPFEVLSRMPDTTIQIVGKEVAPVRDVQGLRLLPDAKIADAGLFDVLVVPGGYGQQALMHDEEVLELIRRHVQSDKLLLSVCTGALLCGAAGVLAGRQVTTHWSARHLMPHYGAELVDARVAVDGNIISAAGVTAGLDAALVLVSFLRGDAAAQEIQLAIEYAPDPIFHSGTPETAPAEVLESFRRKYEPVGAAREAEALRHAASERGHVSDAPVVEIRSLAPGDDTTAFRTLNEEWITRHFTLEAKDHETLNDPASSILLKGGHIFMAYAAGEAVGCVALIPMRDGVYELSKMAVSPHLRGRGLGRRLLQHAIAQARNLGAKSLFLGSNTRLKDAIHLYESVGFRHVKPESLPPMPYSRADVFMEMSLG